MIRCTFFRLLSGIFRPSPDLLATKSPPPASTPSGPSLPPAAEIPQPEWLQEWVGIPRLEIAPDHLPNHSDAHQRLVAEGIFPRIHNGTPFTFRYLGGSQPGVLRQVLPVQLFCLDYFSYFYPRCEDPADIADPDVVPIYLLAWCLSRKAPRTFRLDRIRID